MIRMPIVQDALSAASDDARRFVQRLETAIWLFDIDNSRILYANPAACRLWKAQSAQDLYDRDLGADMTPTVAKRLCQYQSDFLQSDAMFTELWTLYPGGDPRSVMVVYRGYELPDGRMAMQCESLGDLDDQPENLRSAEALLHTDVMITMFSAAGPSLYLNPAARNAFTAPVVSLKALFVRARDYDRILDEVARAGEYRMVSKLRTTAGLRWYDLSIKSCNDAATGEAAYLLTAIDVSELKEARDTARHLADRDQLTGLHNRAYLQGYLNRIETRGDAPGCTVIYFDIDRFKLINDRHGHDAGDTVLKQIARRARDVLRDADLLARLGGDEFVVVMEGAQPDEVTARQIERLRAVIARPITHEKTRIDATISVGIAGYTARTTRFTDVLREADIALYASKQAGRDCTTVFNARMGEAALERDRTEIALERAVRTNEFVLHYQPRLDVATGRIVGAEGLVRWNRPGHGMVAPGDFIPICEETGLIDDLGRIVLSVGCRQAIAWQAAGHDLNVSLNVSPRQFADDKFLPTLRDLAALPGFPVGKLELEITENVLIGDNDVIAEKLRTITAMGYRIAIDDFGTGYSNLSYISRFPLTCLKIDSSFIDQLPASGPVVQLILTLGQQIGATVVSEGVETQAQMDWLVAHHCAEVQGFLITKPLPPTEFEAFLRTYRHPE